MGSWYETCGLSQLAIVDDENVAVFLMKKKSNRMDYYRFCYSDDLFEPVAPVLFGKYLDYGKIEIEKADKRIIDNLYGEQKDYSSIGKLIDEKSIELGIYVMLVHLDLYKEVVEKHGEEKFWFTNKESLRKHNTKKFQKFIIDSKEMPKKYRFMNELFDHHEEYGLRFYNDVTLYKGPEDQLIKNLIDLQIFKNAMSVNRKMFIPQTGKGSQDREHNLAKMIGEFTIKKEKEYMDEC